MLQPCNSYILIHPETTDRTEGGLYLPQDLTPTSNILTTGKVLATNLKCKDIQVGDMVLYNKHAVKKTETKEQILVREEDVYAVLLDK